MAQQIEIIYASTEDEVFGRNQAPSEAWLHSPANLELLSVATGRLGRVNKMRGRGTGLPDKVQVALVKPENALYLIPASAEERGFNIKRYNNATWINIRPLLFKQQMLVNNGEKWRFHVTVVEQSPVGGAALRIGLNEIMEKAKSSKRKSKASTAAKEETADNAT